MAKVLSTKIDRYPAKMVTKLAENLYKKYAIDATSILDPFCGSGAILNVGKNIGKDVYGIDLNPIAELYYNVKIKSFSNKKLASISADLINLVNSTKKILPIQLESKLYWFTPATLYKLEKLRYAYQAMKIYRTKEGKAILLSLMLSIRLCSMSDQRSPKPFVSKISRETRKGRHFDPIKIFSLLLGEIAQLYGDKKNNVNSKFVTADIKTQNNLSNLIGIHSHIITSPPYINAQDYFRNFKLELYFLEDLMEFNTSNIQQKFIGTERGALLKNVNSDKVSYYKSMIPKFSLLQKNEPRLASVVLRYFNDMENAFVNIEKCLQKDGRMILVCGDNLVGGLRIRTWNILQKILEDMGFQLYDFFTDKIENRLLAPKRSGHKGLIKEETICAYIKT